MKKIALTLFAALCIAAMLFVTACKEDEEKCDEDAVQTCVDDAMQCITDAGSDMDAMEACNQESCDCYVDAGCPIDDSVKEYCE